MLIFCSCDKEENRTFIPLQADFEIASPTLTQGLESKITDISIGNIDRRIWNFENGNSISSLDTSATIIFESYGRSTISLIVFDDLEGVSDTMSKDVIIYPGDGLVAYWPLNGNAKDYSENNFDGVFDGPTPVKGIFGKENGAFSFDGEDDNIITSPNIDELLSGGASFSAWVYIDGTMNISTILSNFNGYSLQEGCAYETGFELYLGTIHGVGLQYSRGGDSFAYRSGDNNAVQFGQWHHVIGTWDGALYLDEVNVYIQGLFSNQSGADGTGLSECPYTESGFPFVIGAMQGNVNSLERFFRGSIDEVRIYNRPLTEEEIKLLATTM